MIQVAVNIPPVIKCLITRAQHASMGLKLGDMVHTIADPSSIHLFKE